MPPGIEAVCHTRAVAEVGQHLCLHYKKLCPVPPCSGPCLISFQLQFLIHLIRIPCFLGLVSVHMLEGAVVRRDMCVASKFHGVSSGVLMGTCVGQ